jgi:hypothetical protein
MAVFFEKSPVTSSNCYKTIKTASILKKLGTNVDWIIAFATTCSGLNFLLPWQWMDISKLQKITILRWFFPSKLFSMCCNFSMDWESNAFQRWLHITLWLIWGHFLQFQNFLGDEPPPFKPPKQKGAHLPSGNPLMYLLVGGPQRKSDHFFINISQTKTCVWGPNRTYFHFLTPKRGGWVESALFRVYMR